MKKFLLAALFLSGCSAEEITKSLADSSRNRAVELVRDSVTTCSDGHLTRVAFVNMDSNWQAFSVWTVLDDAGKPVPCQTQPLIIPLEDKKPTQ